MTTPIERTVPHEPLHAFAVELLAAAGLPEDQARVTADVLVSTNLRGVDSHGVRLLPGNVRRVLGGAIKRQPQIETLVSAGSMEIRTDDFGIGMACSVHAMERAIELAADHGVGWVISRNANHSGALGAYVLVAVERGFIGISTATSSPFMAVHGAAEGAVGNNPFAFGAPGKQFPIVLDMAMSVASGGRMGMMRRRGEPIPDEWIIKSEDRGGRGAARPFGGPKGSGLAVMTEILTGVLAGGGLLKDLRVGSGYSAERPDNNSHTQIAINLKALVPEDQYDASIARLVEEIKGAKRAPDVDEILLPGERTWRTKQKRLAEGIPLDETTVGELEKVAGEVGVKTPWA